MLYSVETPRLAWTQACVVPIGATFMLQHPLPDDVGACVYMRVGFDGGSSWPLVLAEEVASLREYYVNGAILAINIGTGTFCTVAGTTGVHMTTADARFKLHAAQDSCPD